VQSSTANYYHKEKARDWLSPRIFGTDIQRAGFNPSRPRVEPTPSHSNVRPSQALCSLSSGMYTRKQCIPSHARNNDLIVIMDGGQHGPPH
jgi:hypothetical protein